MNPRFPVYIISKGRWNIRQTSDAFKKINIPHKIIVEASQFNKYAEKVGEENVLILPQEYLDKYETLDDLGSSKSKGPGAARNFAWDHSIENGHDWHWVFDDNIAAFYILNRNRRIGVDSGTFLYIMEDFALRYENIAIAGPNYMCFAKNRDKLPPFILNTRIYSMLLINNKIPYRWRGRYNEDTDLSLRALKDKWVTVQFNAFLGDKTATQRISGGNTEEFYKHEGTTNKSEMLSKIHPDVSKVTYKFNRCHHHVNYEPFKKNKLIRKEGWDFYGINNYGLSLKKIK